MSASLTVATYNIHKGFSQFNRRVIVHELRERLRALDADVVFLQEVQASSRRHANRHEDWPEKPQHEFLADEVWREVAYGRNAIYDDGHHGNAILSRYPILSAENLDVSAHVFERRGLLHVTVEVPGAREPVHCVNVHLGLFERGRRYQMLRLCERMLQMVPPRAPLVVAGDFNDWRRNADRMLREHLRLDEVFRLARGRPARTYPAVFPLFHLDRIYARGLDVDEVGVHGVYPGARLSDHAALSARLRLAPI